MKNLIIYKCVVFSVVLMLIYEKFLINTDVSVSEIRKSLPNQNMYLKYMYSITAKDGKVFKHKKTKDSNERMRIPLICRQFPLDRIIGPCKRYIGWRNRIENNTVRRTRAKFSRTEVSLYISEQYNIYVAKIRVQTYDVSHRKKNYGGDWWRAMVTGPTQFNVELEDKSDGSYTGWFLVIIPGEYTLQITLEHSLCEGLSDPPLDWFTKGTLQGKYQPDGILGHIDHFLNENIKAINFKVEPSLMKTTAKIHLSPNFTNSTCKPINTACGYWTNGTYQGYVRNGGEDNQKFRVEETFFQYLETLWIFGDSQGRRLYKSLKNHKLCQHLFKHCTHTYTWTYKHFSPDSHDDRFVYTGADFNETKFLMDINSDLQQDAMKTSKSVYLINFGVHIIMTLQLERGFKLFQLFLQMIKEMREKNKENFPLIIWKSTTLPVIENTKQWNITHARFLTKQRVEAWNSYTLKYACEANLPVLDVHDLPLATPYPPIDHVHYPFNVFRKSEDELLLYLLKQHDIR